MGVCFFVSKKRQNMSGRISKIENGKICKFELIIKKKNFINTLETPSLNKLLKRNLELIYWFNGINWNYD